MLDFIYPVILIVCLLSILWLFLKPKKVHEVHYLIHKNKQKILDISKAYDLYEKKKNISRLVNLMPQFWQWRV